MVNCVTCKKAFKLKFGKNKTTRCENCAIQWREQQQVEKSMQDEKNKRDEEFRMKELQIKEKQLELEKQKVTIKETKRNGTSIELTCYYDHNAQNKVSELLSGARYTLPSIPTSPKPTSLVRRKPPSNFKLFEESLEHRKQRKLPSIDALRSRVEQRHKLEDECGSSAGSGMSVD